MFRESDMESTALLKSVNLNNMNIEINCNDFNSACKVTSCKTLDNDKVKCEMVVIGKSSNSADKGEVSKMERDRYVAEDNKFKSLDTHFARSGIKSVSRTQNNSVMDKVTPLRERHLPSSFWQEPNDRKMRFHMGMVPYTGDVFDHPLVQRDPLTQQYIAQYYGLHYPPSLRTGHDNLTHTSLRSVGRIENGQMPCVSTMGAFSQRLASLQPESCQQCQALESFYRGARTRMLFNGSRLHSKHENHDYTPMSVFKPTDASYQVASYRNCVLKQNVDAMVHISSSPTTSNYQNPSYATDILHPSGSIVEYNTPSEFRTSVQNQTQRLIFKPIAKKFTRHLPNRHHPYYLM